MGINLSIFENVKYIGTILKITIKFFFYFYINKYYLLLLNYVLKLLSFKV